MKIKRNDRMVYLSMIDNGVAFGYSVRVPGFSPVFVSLASVQREHPRSKVTRKMVLIEAKKIRNKLLRQKVALIFEDKAS